MPTKPVETIVNRDLSRVAANELRERFVPLVEELVNHGTAVYARCKPAVPNEKLTESDVPLLMYLHILEMADGIAELLNASCASPAVPLVRTIFETHLGLEYCLAADYSRRSRSWLVAYAVEQLDGCNDILGEEKTGKALQAAMQKDGGAASLLDFSSLAPAARAQKTKFEEFLRRPEFVEILNARAVVPGPYPKWYSLFGGASNLRELARTLNRETEYLLFYGFWSSIDHGLNTRRFLTRATSSDKTVRLMRDSSEFMQVVLATTTFILRATRHVLGKYRPSEDLQQWYFEEVRPRFIGSAAGA